MVASGCWSRIRFGGLLIAGVFGLDAAAEAGGLDDLKTCAPGAVMDRLVEEKNLGLAGAKAEQIAGLYDAFFQIMRRCNSVGDLDFAVKLDWGDPFVSRLLGAPPLPDYTYEQRLSKTNELCLSREGMESVLSRDTPWYCEKSGWVDKL